MNIGSDAARILQITDTHLFANPSRALLKLNTQDSFERVLALIAARERDLDLIVATGDISQDASPEAYTRFCDAMKVFAVPFLWLPGNHDSRAVMDGIRADLQQGGTVDALPLAVTVGNWRIITLDSAVPGEVHGYLADTELARLEEELMTAAGEGQHAMVCLHHNPVPGSAGWMSDIGLHNQDAFLAIIDRHRCVGAVVYGHIHQELDFERNGVRYFCTPSTCIQFKPNVADFTLDELNPAYRWYTLHNHGAIDSGVVRLTDFVAAVDHSATGY